MTATALDDASRMQVTVRGRVDIPGPEDITIDHEAGVAFVSSQQRRAPCDIIEPWPDRCGSNIPALSIT